MRQDPKVGAVATIRVWSRFWRQPKSAKKIRQKDTHFRFISGKEKDLFVSGTEKTAKMFNENFLHSIFNLDTYLGLREPDSPNLRVVSWNLNTESVAFRWWRTPFAYHLRIWLDQVIHPLKGPVFGRTGDSAGNNKRDYTAFCCGKTACVAKCSWWIWQVLLDILRSWSYMKKCCKLFAEQKWAELENKQKNYQFQVPTSI